MCYDTAEDYVVRLALGSTLKNMEADLSRVEKSFVHSNLRTPEKSQEFSISPPQTEMSHQLNQRQWVIR